MAKVREYNFPTGFETSTIPDPGTPSASNDTISYGYLNNLSYWGAAVADYTALTALTATQRADNQIRQVDATPTELWKYDTNSTATDDGSTVLQPDDAPANGRWLIIQTGAGGSGGTGAGVELLKQKAQNEHYDIATPPIENSVASGFANSKQTVNGVLLADHTSGTTLYVAWNPKFVNDSDKDTDSATGWSAVGAGATLTTSGTKKIGTASLQFDKNNTTTEAGIRYDRGAQDFAINGFTTIYVWLNMPSITGFADAYLKVYADSTSNYDKYTVTTDDAGSSIAVGWNLLKFDVSVPGTSTGTGWDKTKLSRYIEVGVDTTGAAQTYTAILVDALMFSIDSPTKLIQARNEYDIYDTSNLSTFIIDNASTRVSGTVTLAASLATAYSGGSSSSIRRQTAQITGNNFAEMEQGLSGTIATNQTVRVQSILGTSISSQTLSAFVNCDTNMFFEVTEVTDSTNIKVSDSADSTANLVNGKVIHVFKVHYNDAGQKFYEYRNLDLTISSSSHLSGITTLTTGTNTGIAVGDIVILKVQTTSISLIAASGANENFQTPTLDDILVTDLGLQYPNVDKLYAHYLLGGSDYNKIQRGSLGKDLTVNGTLTTNYDFLNSQYATGGWTDSNYLSLSTADSANITGVSGGVDISFWCKPTSFTGSARMMISRHNGAAAGYYVYCASSSNTIYLALNSSATISGVVFTPDAWNHVVVRLESGVLTYIYVNAVQGATTSASFSDGASTFYVGRYNSTTQPATGIYLADLDINLNGTAWTSSQVEAIYNRGLGRIFSYKPGIDYRYSISSMTGQVMTIKSILDHTTDAALPKISSLGAIKT